MLYYKATAGCGVRVWGVSVRKRTAPVSLILLGRAAVLRLHKPSGVVRVSRLRPVVPKGYYPLKEFSRFLTHRLSSTWRLSRRVHLRSVRCVSGRMCDERCCPC